ncbi:hypothetical protein GKE82_00550 [Conexibacter sp. W3-3-2]|uniref:DUF7701 domain-containing protein n=1 Tax=Conexibacter sp. W3-3-2 TaxID=2675227 RepID=UPI0012BA21FD|nr:hypothetical protein [Conexibacter sp. W3-3-2]MTD42831.1 hypothetical protein [Conexibacter sp. W3-3-2]
MNGSDASVTEPTYVDTLAARIREATPSDLIPDDAGESEVRQLFRLYALLALVRGRDVSAADVHDAWSVWMLGRGEGDHESIVPFVALDDAAQEQDDPFVRAIRAAVAG